ncbi:WhiB family transcriptional regulator [Pseudonocardia sp. WMMC193]|uniref:WhiB family transcriptional regulator n=1 Tax=Pseudonocardia sp. WMMC193 TaxID=2911965 RepID=UPI0027E07CF1|nr:WhiB family transcriptional regulator [Pseudonocardia sp. WMMC193]
MADTRRLPPALLEQWEWQKHAACRGMDSTLFFHPEAERGPSRTAREQRAKQICAACPVLETCRRHALSAEEPYGVWGGLSEHERLSLTRPHRRVGRT